MSGGDRRKTAWEEMPSFRRIGLAALAGSLVPWVALAQSQPAAPPAPSASVTGNLPEVTVIGTTPLPGTGIDIDKVPANVQTLSSSDLSREGAPSLINTLNNRAGSVSTSGETNDPFQPDIFYRGFAASPVLGTPQGLAVYQNGVRVNEAFGDVVNWDLIPSIAIDRVDLVSANPVYGLNALGGSVLVTMKNGFTYQGFENELAGGSFDQFSNSLQYGKQVGGIGAYLGGTYYQQEGWRQFAQDRVQQLYSDVGARGHGATVDISFSGANNFLASAGATPVQELAAGRSLVFTTPQSNTNQLEFVTLSASYQATDALSFQGNVYRREFHQTVSNGNTTNFTACTTGNGLLCQSDGVTPLTSTTNGTIPDLSNGGTVPIGENDFETIHAVTYGGSAQTTYTGGLFGHENNFVVGGSIDNSKIDFQSETEVGQINPSLQVEASNFFVFTPENSGFSSTPVGLRTISTYYGAFISDTFNVTPALAVTASGRYNFATLDLNDYEGSNLTGYNTYARFNPAVGVTYKILPSLTAYAGYSEGNRTPSPSELECSNPALPCVLPSSLSSDPSLKQVVSHTYEAGLRGRFTLPDLVPGRFGWNFGLFRTNLDNDIYGVATSISTTFFENIGSTRRQGIETGIAYNDEKWSVYGNYSLVDATFRSPLTLPSPSNPFADAAGNIQVSPGDRLPGIPEHQLKLGADYHVTPHWTVGGTFIFNSDQFFRGDESNQNKPLPGYEVVNLHSSYTVTKNFELFADLSNLFDTRYATFGTFGDPTGVGAPGVPTNGIGVDNRFISPATPIAVFGGVRVTF
jgi:iron complex outermembrane recepter protein